MISRHILQISLIGILFLGGIFSANVVSANPNNELFLGPSEAQIIDEGQKAIGAKADVNAGVAWVADKTIGAGLAFMTGASKDILATALNFLINPIMKPVMEFSNFFTAGVNTGWKVTRDFTNLFFALILLLIGISTVLQIGPLDNYTAKKILPNFIMVALFINFSKAIVGFLIDISQILMITFYNAFGAQLGDVVTKVSRVTELGVSAKFDVAFINLMTIAILVVLIFVLLWTIVILVVRIVTLWLAIILSPLAFMSFLIPGLRSLWNQWIQMLESALVTGPVLMFMIYLSITVMTGAGFGIEVAESANFIASGAFLNYLLVIVLLFAANMVATKAGQSAPALLQKSVAVAGTVATLGIGKYVGAGGYGTGTMVKTGVKGADLVAGGSTNITGQNARYETAKKDFKTQQTTGTGIFGKDTRLGKFNPLRATQGLTTEGKNQQLEDFEKKKAIQLANEGKLEKEENKRYQKIASTLQGAAATEIKDEFNVEKLGGDLEKALQEGDKFTAMALSTRISELKGWSKIFAPGTKYGKYSLENEQESAQLDAFINDNFERKDSSGKIMGDKMTNSFRSRQVNILNDKGAGNWATGLAERDVKNPTYSPEKKAAKAGIVGAGDILAKNNDVFNSRVKIDGKFVTEDGKAKYNFDIAKFAPVIENETSLKELKKSKNWNKYAPIKKDITNAIQDYFSILSTDSAEANKKYPSLSVIPTEKLQAALKGLTK